MPTPGARQPPMAAATLPQCLLGSSQAWPKAPAGLQCPTPSLCNSPLPPVLALCLDIACSHPILAVVTECVKGSCAPVVTVDVKESLWSGMRPLHISGSWHVPLGTTHFLCRGAAQPAAQTHQYTICVRAGKPLFCVPECKCHFTRCPFKLWPNAAVYK